MSQAPKSPLKQGEKILFGIVGVFLILAVLSFAVLEIVRVNSDTPMFQSKTSFNLSPEGHRGSQIFRESQCTACHRAMRNGTNMGLSLDGVGSKRSVDWLERFLADPEKTYETGTLDHGFRPKEAAYVSELPAQDRRALAVFLSELRAEQGSPSSPVPPEGKSEFIDNMIQIWAPDDWKEKYRDVRETNRDQQPPPE